jgi:GR25 family glycosyltransferase involved in LPS biosynthesis
MRNINDYFDNIYCLNLESRQDRWTAISNKFKKFGIKVERFLASGPEDKEVFDKFELLKMRQSHPKAITSIGAMGCLISHIRIIKDAKLKKYSKILIFEDDIIFKKSFVKDLSILDNVKYYKILYLGSSQHNWDSIDLNNAKNNGFYRAYKSQGTFAYALDESIYDVCLKYFSEYIKPVDFYLTEIQELTKHAYVIYPNLIIADVTDSNIRQPRNQVQHSIKLKWKLNEYDT